MEVTEITRAIKLADVYVNIPIKSIAQAYTYIVPPELHFLSTGWRVMVPFGGRQVEGFIVSTSAALDGGAALAATEKIKSEEGYELKAIVSTVDQEPWFTPDLLKLAMWIADFYLCAPSEIMRLFMPGKSGVRLSVCYSAVPEMGENMLLMVDSYRRVYETLLGENLTLLQLKKRLPELKASMEDILEKLLRYNLVEKSYESSSRAKARIEKSVVIKAFPSPEELETIKRNKAQVRLVGFLNVNASVGEIIPMKMLRNNGFDASVVKALEKRGWLEIQDRRVLRDSYSNFSVDAVTGRELTIEQRNAVNAITDDILLGMEKRSEDSPNKPFLLHGVTGSGKTLVYMEATRFARSLGKNVIVLVPEIALTGQLVKNFKEYFTQDIIVIHSRLSINERNDAIVRIRQGEAGIIIGARSALFTPVENIGLIIIDEEQDNSYKQDESPRYHARQIAEAMAKFYGSTLVLGSATPSMESYYRAKTGEYRLLKMKNRVGNRPLPLVESVDMRNELRMGRKTVLSGALQQLINTTIEKKEQLILMLNRRGFSTFVMCRSCGHVMGCPDCGLPLVYHKDGRLLCHHCDIHARVPDVCPKCGSRYIKYFGSGTEKLETELGQLVPNARTIRMDRDTTTGKFAHTDILTKFRSGQFDILLGTQMVAKGHDIPNVTAVGIISADSALNMPDFRASERVFMLITQTAGRAGRGELPGRVIVQTYNPEHYAVTCGMAHDYENFYAHEIEVRKELFYPPFSRIIKLVFQQKTVAGAMTAAKNFRNKLEAAFMGTQHTMAIGPAPAMIHNFKGTYRYCIIIKTANISAVQAFLRQEGIHLDNTVAIDIDPISTT